MSVKGKQNTRKLEKFMKTDIDEFWNDCLNYDGENLKTSEADGSEQFLTCKNIFLMYQFS